MGEYNFVDIIIILVILLGGVVGFRDGVLKRLVSVIGMILVIILSFYLKNYLSVIFYENLPFLKFSVFKATPVLNIIFYYLLALLIVASILGVVYYLLVSISGIIEKVLKMTVILSIPSKILGFVVGLIENYLWVYIFIFIITLIPNVTIRDVDNSKLVNSILNNTPIVSNYTGKVKSLSDDIKEAVDNDAKSTEENNEKVLDLMLKYDFITVKSVDKLIEQKKVFVNLKPIIERIINRTKKDSTD